MSELSERTVDTDGRRASRSPATPATWRRPSGAWSTTTPAVRATALGALDRLGALDDERLARRVRRPRRRRAAPGRRARRHAARRRPRAGCWPIPSPPWSRSRRGRAASTSTLPRRRARRARRPRRRVRCRRRRPLVREAAVAALGAIGDDRGLDAILAATTDRPAIRRRAVLALAPFVDPDHPRAAEVGRGTRAGADRPRLAGPPGRRGRRAARGELRASSGRRWCRGGRSRCAGTGGWRRRADGRLVRLTSLAPRRRASSSAARLSASPMPWPPGRRVDDDVLDPRLQAGRDAVEGQRERADDAPVEAGEEQLAVRRVDDRRELGRARAAATTTTVAGSAGRTRRRARRRRTGRCSMSATVPDRTRRAAPPYRAPGDPESKAARQLGSVLEPVTGQVYFSPECHARLRGARLRAEHRASSTASPRPTARPTSRAAAACSARCRARSWPPRSACSTRTPSCPAVTFGWTKTDAATICQARTDGAIAQLERVLGPEPDGVERANELLARAVEPLRPEGRSLFAGQAALDLPDDHARPGLAARRHAARVPRRQPHRGVDRAPASTPPRSAC